MPRVATVPTNVRMLLTRPPVARTMKQGLARSTTNPWLTFHLPPQLHLQLPHIPPLQSALGPQYHSEGHVDFNLRNRRVLPWLSFLLVLAPDLRSPASLLSLSLLVVQLYSRPSAIRLPTLASTVSMRGIPIIPNIRQNSLPPYRDQK